LLAATGCYTSRNEAADTNTSWLATCTQQSDCDEGFSCMRGLCRAQAAAEGAGVQAATPEQSPKMDAPFDGAATVIAVDTSRALASATGVEPGEPLVLSKPYRQGGAPHVRWLGDHWTATWSSSAWVDENGEAVGDDGKPTTGSSGPWIESIDLAPDGTPGVRTELPFGGLVFGFDVELGVDGRLAVTNDYAPCVLESISRDGGSDAPFAVPCGGEDPMAVAPVPDSEDWLIAYGAGASAGNHQVGRYRPSLRGWVIPPIAIGPREDYDDLGVFAVGDDAVVAWGNPSGSSIAWIAELAAAEAPTHALSPSPPTALGGGLLREDGRFALADQGSSAVLVGADGSQLWAAAIARDAQAVAARAVATAGVADRKPGIAAAPELAAFAVCYATGPGPGGGFGRDKDGVSFLLVDQQGAAIGEPVVLADDLENIGGCDVAWSGAAFLAVWWDIELNKSSEASSLIRAQLLAPAANERD
jgi:hypothetical protein